VSESREGDGEASGDSAQNPALEAELKSATTATYAGLDAVIVNGTVLHQNGRDRVAPDGKLLRNGRAG
jgi:hypothetical protein